MLEDKPTLKLAPYEDPKDRIAFIKIRLFVIIPIHNEWENSPFIIECRKS